MGKMIAEQTILYEGLSEIFERYPNSSIDRQSETVEMLQIVQAIYGRKPSFLAIISADGRAGPYEDVLRLIKTLNVPSEISPVAVHHRYRDLKIGNDDVNYQIASRSIDKHLVFWITRQSEFENLFRNEDTTAVSDSSLLGYPECCAFWHYDCFFARGTEAFYEVYQRETSPPEVLKYFQEQWRPLSGWFLPQEFYLAALLRGNLRFPFVDHVACPNCLAQVGSPTSLMNQENEQLSSPA